ncbi:MAG: hypothetical protein ACYC7E_13630 [Armatimonadota bacterium]
MEYLAGSLVLMGLVILGFNLWGNNALSCSQAVGMAAFGLLFLALNFVPGAFPWSLFALLLPVIYLVLALRPSGSQRRLLHELRQEDYAVCERIVAQDPRNAAAHARLGQLYEEDKLYAQALEAYEESLRLDERQPQISYRFRMLQETVGLKESRQVRCPGCVTIQPADTGICWKCGRVFNRQRALATHFSRMGQLGRGMAMVFVGSFTLFLSTLVIRWVSGGVEVTLIVIPLILSLGSGAYAWWAYQQVLQAEFLTRGETEYDSNFGNEEEEIEQ